MRRTFICLFFLSSVVFSQTGDPLDAEKKLTKKDRKDLLEEATDLRDRLQARRNGLRASAAGALNSAISSDAKAHSLYMKCVEKILFEDLKKSTKDFREWKKRHRETEDTPALRRALRHQAAWLHLTLKAAQNPEPENRSRLAKLAIKRIDSILEDRKKMENMQSLLGQDVRSSLLGQFLGLQRLDVTPTPAQKAAKQKVSWCFSPLPIPSVYDQIILPPYREAKNIGGLKAAWKKRILQEGISAKHWGKKLTGVKPGEKTTAAFDKFLLERKPVLEWAMHRDLFQTSRNEQYILPMLSHLKKYAKHSDALAWSQELVDLLDPPEKTEPEAAKEDEEDWGD